MVLISALSLVLVIKLFIALYLLTVLSITLSLVISLSSNTSLTSISSSYSALVLLKCTSFKMCLTNSFLHSKVKLQIVRVLAPETLLLVE